MKDLEDVFNITNKRSHPTNETKVVYRHTRKVQADYFARLLEENAITFESQVDEDDEHKPVYFGISRIHEIKADKLNYTALGLNREKFLPTNGLRILVFIIALLAVLLGIVGAIVSNA